MTTTPCNTPLEAPFRKSQAASNTIIKRLDISGPPDNHDARYSSKRKKNPLRSAQPRGNGARSFHANNNNGVVIINQKTSHCQTSATSRNSTRGKFSLFFSSAAASKTPTPRNNNRKRKMPTASQSARGEGRRNIAGRPTTAGSASMRTSITASIHQHHTPKPPSSGSQSARSASSGANDSMTTTTPASIHSSTTKNASRDKFRRFTADTLVNGVLTHQDSSRVVSSNNKDPSSAKLRNQSAQNSPHSDSFSLEKPSYLKYISGESKDAFHEEMLRNFLPQIREGLERGAEVAAAVESHRQQQEGASSNVVQSPYPGDSTFQKSYDSPPASIPSPRSKTVSIPHGPPTSPKVSSSHNVNSDASTHTHSVTKHSTHSADAAPSQEAASSNPGTPVQVPRPPPVDKGDSHYQREIHQTINDSINMKMYVHKDDVKEKLSHITKVFEDKLKTQYSLMHSELLKQQDNHKEQMKLLQMDYEQRIDQVMKRYFSFKAENRKFKKFQQTKHKMQQQIHTLRFQLEQANSDLDRMATQHNSLIQKVEHLMEDKEDLQNIIQQTQEERDELQEELDRIDMDRNLTAQLQKELAESQKKITKLHAEAQEADRRAKQQQEMLEEELRRTHEKSKKNDPAAAKEIAAQVRNSSWIKGDELTGFTGYDAAYYDDDFNDHVRKKLELSVTEKLKIVVRDDSITSGTKKKLHGKMFGSAQQSIHSDSSTPVRTQNYFEDRLVCIKGHIDMLFQGVTYILRILRTEMSEGSFALSEQKEFLELVERNVLSFKSNLGSAMTVASDTLKMVRISTL